MTHDVVAREKKGKPLASAMKHLPPFVQRALGVRFVRFLLVGGLNAAFGYSVWSVLILLGLHYTAATFLGTVIGILFNFKTYGALVFHSKNNWLIFRFFASYGITYCLNVACLWVLDRLHVPMLIAGASLLLPMGIVSYFIQRKLVFIDSRVESSLQVGARADEGPGHAR